MTETFSVCASAFTPGLTGIPGAWFKHRACYPSYSAPQLWWKVVKNLLYCVSPGDLSVGVSLLLSETGDREIYSGTLLVFQKWGMQELEQLKPLLPT